jgi:RND superfamily putative drug exporter
VATTGRVITAAATIMVCVFLAFVLPPERPVKMFGLSLATGGDRPHAALMEGP